MYGRLKQFYYRITNMQFWIHNYAANNVYNCETEGCM